jgi:hypothetical protein
VEAIAGVLAGSVVLAITGAMVWLGVKALGTPADRAAANQTLQATAILLDARFRDRTEIPWYRRPAQYGAIEGELCGLKYELFLMPWNSEDSGGLAMLEIPPRPDRPLAGNKYGQRVFFPEEVCHWPDRADPVTLADYVRQAMTAAASGEASS